MGRTGAMVRNPPEPGQNGLAPWPSRGLVAVDRRLISTCVVWLAIAGPGTAAAAEWRIQPSVQVAETYTDNVSLLPASQGRSDFITEISPGIAIEGRGARASLQLNYKLQDLLYARESNNNALNHFLSATGKAELVSNWVFFDADAKVTRQNISSLGAQGIDFTNNNINTAETRSYRFGPYVRNKIDGAFDYEVRYQRNHVSTDAQSTFASALTSDANRFAVALDSGTSTKHTGWGFDYTKESVYYRDALFSNTSSEITKLNGRYALNARFGLLATVGYETYRYAFTGPQPQGSLWDVGFTWTPSNLTNLTAKVGDRFFGKTYALDFSHRSRALLWTAQYSEDVMSTRSEILSGQAVDTFSRLDAIASATIKDPVERARFVNNYIINNGLPATSFSATNSFTDRLFLEKRLNGSVTYNTPRTTSILNVFRADRDAGAIGAIGTTLSSDSFTDDANSVQTGAGLLFNWRFASRTGLDFSVGSEKIRFRTIDRNDDFRYARLGLRRQLGPKLTGSIDYRHLVRTSNVAFGDYTENAIRAALNIRF